MQALLDVHNDAQLSSEYPDPRAQYDGNPPLVCPQKVVDEIFTYEISLTEINIIRLGIKSPENVIYNKIFDIVV